MTHGGARPHPRRTHNPCHWCGRITTAVAKVCVECIGVDRSANEKPSHHYALTGGRWVLDPVRRVQVWQAGMAS